MKLGLWLAMIGGALLAASASVVPWQSFELMAVGASALDLGGYGWVLLALSLAVIGVGAWGLVTGRRKPASGIVLALSAGLVFAIALGRVDETMGFDLVPLEVVHVDIGFAMALLAVVFVFGGAFVTRQTLATWDSSSPLLRVAIMQRHAGEVTVVADTLVYEPQTLSLRALAPAAGELPTVVVTQEGDVSVRGTEGMRVRLVREGVPVAFRGEVALGDQAVVTSGAWHVVMAHVMPPADGRVPAPTLSKSEVWAFGAAALVGLLGMAMAPIVTWTEQAILVSMCEVGMCPGVVAKTEPDAPDVTVLDAPVLTELEAEPERTSKAIGGPEGALGDPTVTTPRDNVIPKIDAPLMTKTDRAVGLNALIDRELATSSVVAEVFRGDVAATTDRIARAMEGDGDVFVLGPGQGLGFQGNEDGGPGQDGPGRLRGIGEIDTGGPGISVNVGKPPPKRKVAVMDNGPLNQNGGCSAANIRNVVMRRAAAIRACYERELQVKPTLGGKLTARWTIVADGSVTNASAIVDTVGDGGVTRCVLDWVRRMKFEPPAGGLCVVQWPFVFSSGAR